MNELPDVGHGVEPMTRGGIKGRQIDQFESAQEVLLHIPDGVLDPPLLVGLLWATSLDLEPVVLGEIKVARVEAGWPPRRMLQHRYLTVIDHHLTDFVEVKTCRSETCDDCYD